MSAQNVYIGMMNGESKMLALNALFEECRPVLYSIALQMLGHGDDAKDAVQETLLKAIMHIDSLKDPLAIGGWLKAILRNQCLMELRYKKRRLTSESGYYKTADMVADAFNESEQSPYGIREAIGELSETLQATAMLRFYGRFNSYEDMANILSVPVGTIRSRLAEVRSKLATQLKPGTELVAKSQKAREMEVFYSEKFESVYDDDRERSRFLNHLDNNLLIILTSGKTVTGKHYIEQEIDYDLYHGSRATVQEVHSTGNISVLEIKNINPPHDPTVCPPASTFIMVHPGNTAHKMYFHNASRITLGQ